MSRGKTGLIVGAGGLAAAQAAELAIWMFHHPGMTAGVTTWLGRLAPRMGAPAWVGTVLPFVGGGLLIASYLWRASNAVDGEESA